MVAELLPQCDHFVSQLPLLQRSADEQAKVFGVRRFDEEIVRPELHRPDGIRHTSVPRGNDYSDWYFLFDDGFEKLHPR